ncbi:hypothetical protein MWU76_12510 [Gelidibacter sp. F2691]|nr:hypothetical protein [Gelidibacter sp. F2691]
MRKIGVCVLFLIIFFSCKGQGKKIENPKKRSVAVDYGVQAFSEIQKENETIIKLLEDCFNTQKFSDYSQFWDKSDTIYFSSSPYDDLYTVLNQNYPTYKPTIISIQKLNADKFLLKIAVIGNPEGFFSIDYIYNVYAIKDENKKFNFKNTISDNLKNWIRDDIDNITYYYPKNRILDQENIQKQIAFEYYLSDFFSIDKVNYKYVICENINHIYKILGYDYVDAMFFTEQLGAVSYSYQNIFFAGNDSEYYPHEATHIYIRKKFPEINIVLNEGLATYLGGSKGMSYQEHVKVLIDFLDKEHISVSEHLFDNEKRYKIIGSNSSIMYSCGAFICHLAIEKYGKNELFKLINNSGTNEELKKAIEEVFKININEFDDFFEKELKKFKNEFND